jgi:CDP-6-deoxy-D-xylo-4-hexulose-3-dehydrase
MKHYNWPLATSPFTFIDKLVVSSSIIFNDRYTMGDKVSEFEKKFSEFSGRKALMVANGSVANHLVFELWKLKNPNIKPVVIVPAVTWISSITPAMMAGMDIVFCDVNLQDFCFDYISLEKIVKENSENGRRVIIWPTALIGWSPNMALLDDIAKKYNAELFLDSCENTLAEAKVNVYDENGKSTKFVSILASADITTTSCYLSHYVCSVEGGFVFFKDEKDYEMGRMFRNHGMIRSLAPDNPYRVKIEKENSDIDPQFLFALPGTNLRPSDVHAMFGLRDFKRIEKNRANRIKIYKRFYNNLDFTKYYLPEKTITHVPFCLPVFRTDNNLKSVKKLLSSNGIETRPIIGSNLLRQIPFKKYGNAVDFKNAEWIHNHGVYVGVHDGVNDKMIDNLTGLLNDL